MRSAYFVLVLSFTIPLADGSLFGEEPQDAAVSAIFKFTGTPNGGELTIKAASDTTKSVKVLTQNGDSNENLHKKIASALSGKLGTLSAVATKNGVFVQNANAKSFIFESTDTGIQLPPSAKTTGEDDSTNP